VARAMGTPATGSNKLLGENLARFWAGGDGVAASSTFLKASSKELFVALVVAVGSGTKVLVPCSALLADGVCGRHILLGGFVVGHLPSSALAGVVASCVVPACASDFSSLWSG
jgi:hypothetical protein